MDKDEMKLVNYLETCRKTESPRYLTDGHAN
jgi:hypothetical protein